MKRLPAPSRVCTVFASTVLAVSLAACSSTRPPSGAGTSASRGDSGRPPVAAKPGGGGYYLDDGPGANAPKDLDAIPDAVPRAEPLNPRTARPYVVFDRQYVPMTALAPYRERGVASWYGRRYHGQRTSSGEVYDMYAMTAAHPTLPIPSYVRVTNVGNGRSVVVRVNDRGPFLNSRLIDLSYTAAAKLGYVNAGSAEVDVELITQFDQRDQGMQARAAAGTGSPASNTGASATGTAQRPAGTVPPRAAATTTVDPNSPGVAVASGAVSLGAAPEKLQLETVLAPAAPVPDAASSGPVSPGPAPAGAASAGGSTAGSATGGAAPGSASSPSPAVPTIANAAPGVYLQLGAFSSREAAESTRTRIARDLDGVVTGVEVRQEGALFKLHAGPYSGRADALAAADRIRQLTAMKPFAVTR